MKICLINTYYYPIQFGGAEVSVQNLAENLIKKGHEVCVITLGRSKKVEWVNSVKVHYLKIKNLYLAADGTGNIVEKSIWHTFDSYNLIAAREAMAIINQESPDIVHSHNLSGFSVAIWKLIKAYNYPLVHTLRDYYLLCPRGSKFKENKNCQKQCFSCKILSMPKKRLSGYVDTVTGISRHVLKEHLSDNYFQNATEQKVIYNSVKTNNRPSRIDFDKERIKIGFLGRLEPQKGIEFLLRNFPRESFELRIGGDGEKEYVKYLENTYDHSSVRFLGYVDKSEFFEKIHFLIVPSLWQEPFGRVVIESYSHGIPVIGSNNGGIPELIQEEETGWIFDTSKKNELENLFYKLQNLNKVTYRLMSQKCEIEVKKYSESKIATKYLKLYQKLAPTV